MPKSVLARTPSFLTRTCAVPAPTPMKIATGRNAKPGLDRLEAQDLLDVERGEEEQREQAAGDQQEHDVR